MTDYRQVLPKLGETMPETRERLLECFKLWKTELRGQSIPGTEELALILEECGPSGVNSKEVEGTASYIPLYTASGELAGILRCGSSSAGAVLAFSLAQACAQWKEGQYRLECTRRLQEAKRSEMLFLCVKKLHDKIDVEGVLQEVMSSIGCLYPGVQADLLLSQDDPTPALPVKPLSFKDPQSDMCTRAFIEGKLIYTSTSRADNAGVSEVAAPLMGKQGVYGILHLISSDDLLQTSDIPFISNLADIAGSAFENAKVYEQLSLLVKELRLINEITKRLNQSLSLTEIFNYASTELLSIFRADCCCILKVDEENRRFIVKASTLPALFNAQFRIDEGYSGIVFATSEPLIVTDYSSGRKVPSPLMEIAGARSLISTPITVKDRVIGILHVTHRRPNYFSYENFKLLQVLSVHIGLAMSNASLHADVQRMVITDHLTTLYARHYLDDQVNLLQKKDFCGSLILVDVDDFKFVNDTFGHQVGDKILISVSHIIKSCIRESDIAARWGGEELAVYLPQVSREQALRIAERIRQRVMSETSPQVTVSCGVSDWKLEDDKISVESLVYRADMALYEAKHAGRNQVKAG